MIVYIDIICLLSFFANCRIIKPLESLKNYLDDRNSNVPIPVNPMTYVIDKQQNPSVGQSLCHAKTGKTPKKHAFCCATTIWFQGMVQH